MDVNEAERLLIQVFGPFAFDEQPGWWADLEVTLVGSGMTIREALAWLIG